MAIPRRAPIHESRAGRRRRGAIPTAEQWMLVVMVVLTVAALVYLTFAALSGLDLTYYPT